MSKAFQCDNCLECFPGAPAHELRDREICSSCLRGLKALGVIDPFATKIKPRTDSSQDWSRKDFPLHTGEHSQ